MPVKRLVLLLCLCLVPSILFASAAPEHPMSPEEGLAMLLEGNLRFATNEAAHPNTDPSRRLLTAASGQAPFATIIGCSDSRVPVEILFDQGVGDLFVIKVAGNVADTDEIGSAEYGVDHLGTPVLMVLGHSSCGAVTAVTTGAEVHGSIPKLVDNIIPAVERAKKNNPDVDKSDLIASATLENVWEGVASILTGSHAIAERAASGKVVVVGGMYNILTGKVTILGTHPDQSNLLHDAKGAITVSTVMKDSAPAADKPAEQAQPAQAAAPAAKAEVAKAEPAKADHAKAAHDGKESSGHFGLGSFIIFVLLLIGVVILLDKKVLNPDNN